MRLIGLTGLMCISAWTLSPVYLQSGWPQNHEYLGFFERTEVYYQRLLLGDWLPIWSSSDNFGLGSAFPALYHKLFYLSSGLFYLFIDEMKLTILFTLFFWLCIGGIGMYKLCRALHSPRWVAWCGAYMLILANYTITDWLIRGAMAELSAIMLMPWCLAAYLWWLGSNGQKKIESSLLGFFLGIAFLAHSVLAFYLVLLLVVCSIFLFAFQPWRFKLLSPLCLFLVVAAFSIIICPYVYAMHQLGQDYDLKRLLLPVFLPENNYKSLEKYIWDQDWEWGSNWSSFTVQLDLPILLLMVWGILSWVFSRYSRFLSTIIHVIPTKINPWFVYLLLLSIVLLGFLQTPIATTFYQAFPGAIYIQFPWRLLAIMTPLLIVLSLLLCARTNVGRFGIPASLVAMFILCGAGIPIQYSDQPTGARTFSNGLFGFNGSYIPTAVPINSAGMKLDELPNADTVALHQTRLAVFKKLDDHGCTLTQNDIHGREVMKNTYTLDCTKAGIVPLPLFASPWHIVSVAKGDDQKIAQECIKKADTPGICNIALESPGLYFISIQTPTIASRIRNF
jgi:hypothetical protein